MYQWAGQKLLIKRLNASTSRKLWWLQFWETKCTEISSWVSLPSVALYALRRTYADLHATGCTYYAKTQSSVACIEREMVHKKLSRLMWYCSLRVCVCCLNFCSPSLVWGDQWQEMYIWADQVLAKFGFAWSSSTVWSWRAFTDHCRQLNILHPLTELLHLKRVRCRQKGMY